MTSRQTVRKRRRFGFTLVEVLVAGATGVLVAMCATMTLIVTYRTFGQEMRQNEVQARCRTLLSSFSSDAEQGAQVVYIGAGPYTPPNDMTNYGSHVVPAATRLLVFTMQSHDSTGVIPGAYDYIGYGWNQTAQTVVRTRLAYSGLAGTSSSGYSSQVVPYGGNCDAALTVQVHIASSSSSTYKDESVDPFAGSNLSLFQGSPPAINLADIDDLSVDDVISASSWGATLSQEFHSDAKMRNWRQH